MGYPISNLRKDFQDINLDNAEYVARYSTLLRGALFGETDETLSRVPTFDDVSEYYNANKSNLDPVIFNAEVLNNLTQYVEDLKNYTIAVKNQVFFCDINISKEEFDTLYGDIAEGDIIVYTDTQGEYTVFKNIVVKQSDGSYQTVIKFGNSTYYIEITDDDIYSLEETGEEIKCYYSVYEEESHAYHKETESFNTGTYVNIENSDIECFNDGDVLSIRYTKTTAVNPSTFSLTKMIDYFKINGKFYLINYKRTDSSATLTKAETDCLLIMDSVHDFIFSFNGLNKINTNGKYNLGIATFDDEGNMTDLNASLFVSKSTNRTTDIYHEDSRLSDVLDGISDELDGEKGILLVKGAGGTEYACIGHYLSDGGGEATYLGICDKENEKIKNRLVLYSNNAIGYFYNGGTDDETYYGMPFIQHSTVTATVGGSGISGYSFNVPVTFPHKYTSTPTVCLTLVNDSYATNVKKVSVNSSDSDGFSAGITLESTNASTTVTLNWIAVGACLA